MGNIEVNKKELEDKIYKRSLFLYISGKVLKEDAAYPKEKIRSMVLNLLDIK